MCNGVLFSESLYVVNQCALSNISVGFRVRLARLTDPALALIILGKVVGF